MIFRLSPLLFVIQSESCKKKLNAPHFAVKGIVLNRY